MTEHARPPDDLPALCEAAVEGRLTDDQRQALERLVLERPEARRFYVEYLHQHACLHWSAADPAFLPGVRGQESGVRPPDSAPTPRKGARRLVRWAPALAAAALLLGVGLWLALRPGTDQPGRPVATLVNGKACRWDAGSLPTEVGARLTAGRLRLAEGLARITFDSGAEVTLEAPADLEVVSERRCVLRSGRLVAKVPPRATGFVVDTPTVVLKDLGTEFGVNVKDARTADVQVFNGLVDVEHRASGRTERMQTGRSLRFTDRIDEFNPDSEPSAGARQAQPNGEARVLQISTAVGRGKDAYVQPVFPAKGHVDTLLLVKNTVPATSDWARKAYVGLDLAAARGLRIADAQLSFTFAPTGMGYASEVPDATFAVYGLTDEALDDWDEQAVRWPDAPANRPGGAALDPDKVVRLGTFTIAQGELGGTRSVSGPALVEFLARDTNGLATFILVRETPGSGRSDLVHGFASKRHPHLPPPTLKLTVEPPR